MTNIERATAKDWFAQKMKSETWIACEQQYRRQCGNPQPIRFYQLYSHELPYFWLRYPDGSKIPRPAKKFHRGFCEFFKLLPDSNANEADFNNAFEKWRTFTILKS